MHFSVTLVLVIITAIVSITGFSRQNVIDELIFYPPAIHYRKQFYRFITHGFIHADPMHLIFNMIALYSFGENLEEIFRFEPVFGQWGGVVYFLLYFMGLIFASLPDYFKYRDATQFRSLGASGAVSAIIFSMVLFDPQMGIGFFFIPVPIPGWLFAILYLGITAYLDKRGGSRINHSAHFWGAAFGIVFTLISCQLFANDFSLIPHFLKQLTGK